MSEPVPLPVVVADRLGPSSLERPEYQRSTVRAGIAHIGVGGFHRSHQAWYIDRLLAAGRARFWGICGVGLLAADEAVDRALRAQDCLYTLILRHPDGRNSFRVIGSMTRYMWAPRDPAAVLGALTDPAIRIVSLTITEGGYQPDRVDTAGTPVTAFGYLALALQLRRDAGTAPFTVMSCDNVRGNGQIARQATLAAAAARGRALADWIEANVAFPNSMVDRITPATTDGDRALLAQACGVADQWPVVAEAIPSLSSDIGIDYEGYARTILTRFGNRYIRDTVARLCEYGSDRLPTFVLPVLRHNLARGAGTEMSVRAIAAWRRWLAVPDQVTDHRASQLQRAARNPDPLAFVIDPDLFGDLIQNRLFVEQYTRACSQETES